MLMLYRLKRNEVISDLVCISVFWKHPSSPQWDSSPAELNLMLCRTDLKKAKCLHLFITGDGFVPNVTAGLFCTLCVLTEE